MNCFMGYQNFYRAWLRGAIKKEVLLSNSSTRIGDKKTASYQLKIERKGPSFTIRWLEIYFIKSNGKALRLAKKHSIRKLGK